MWPYTLGAGSGRLEYKQWQEFNLYKHQYSRKCKYRLSRKRPNYQILSYTQTQRLHEHIIHKPIVFSFKTLETAHGMQDAIRTAYHISCTDAVPFSEELCFIQYKKIIIIFNTRQTNTNIIIKIPNLTFPEDNIGMTTNTIPPQTSAAPI